MPARLPKACRLPGCSGVAVDRGRCAQHAPVAEAERGRFTSVYQTRRWRRLSQQHRAEHPYCVRCGRLADLVDHVQPHRGDLTLAFDRPLASMCWACHGIKTAAETRR
jgi:5-methylcytosine-specific restriction enzyme A